MAKYSYELKLLIVEEYIRGKGGYKFLAKKYGINNHTAIIKWVNSYKAMGKDGLQRNLKNKSYSVHYKEYAVELYLTTEMSYQDLANELEMNNPSLLANWVRAYRNEGFEGLSKPKGRPAKMTLDKNRKHLDNHKTNRSKEPHVKELEKRVRHLEIENAFLKELRRLRSEESQKATNKSQVSSTPSEDNSN